MSELARVLCVDDEPNLLAALSRGLRGYVHVSLAGSADEALRVLERDESVAVVISDLCMPGMNGLELLESVRRRWPRVARILMSGHGDAAGAGTGSLFRCLPKPVPQSELRAVIAEAVASLKNPSAEPMPSATR